MFYCSETYIFLCYEIIWCSYVKQHIIQTYMFCDFFLMFPNLCLCIFVPYSLPIQVSITDLDVLHQKHLVEKETYSIMIIEWELIKKKKWPGMLPGILMNPGIPFKENSSQQYNDMVFYIWVLNKVRNSSLIYVG